MKSILKAVFSHIFSALTVIAITTSLIGFISPVVHSQGIDPCDIAFCIEGTDNSNYNNPNLTPGQRASYIIGDIAGMLTFFVNAIAIIFVLWGAFLMLTAQGDSQKFKNGLQAIQYSIAGMVISVVAYGIISTLINFFTIEATLGVITTLIV